MTAATRHCGFAAMPIPTTGAWVLVVLCGATAGKRPCGVIGTPVCCRLRAQT
ncbi:MAG: hypothetical protein ACJ762_06305 [Solirubrobacteraceae bacterium]